MHVSGSGSGVGSVQTNDEHAQGAESQPLLHGCFSVLGSIKPKILYAEAIPEMAIGFQEYRSRYCPPLPMEYPVWSWLADGRIKWIDAGGGGRWLSTNFSGRGRHDSLVRSETRTRFRFNLTIDVRSQRLWGGKWMGEEESAYPLQGRTNPG